MRKYPLYVMAAFTLAGCGGSSVNSDDQARLAYQGLDKSISKSLALAFQGYNAASSANIPPEMGPGDASGTLTITGQVSHGNAGQASMNLNVGMVTYSDGKIPSDDKGHTVTITYATAADTAAQPLLSLKLNSSAGNSLTGSLAGDYDMSGDLSGKVHLNLQLDGKFSGTAPNVMRVVGSTAVTGTAINSAGGTFNVNTTL